MEIGAYKGVMIYFNEREGQFYCNVAKNTNEYYAKTDNSKRYEGIKKAIDNAPATVVSDEIAIEFIMHSGVMKEHKVKSRKGNIITFDNGVQYTAPNMRGGWIFQASIKKDKKWKELKASFDAFAQHKADLYEMQKESNEMYRDILLTVKSLSKHRF